MYSVVFFGFSSVGENTVNDTRASQRPAGKVFWRNIFLFFPSEISTLMSRSNHDVDEGASPHPLQFFSRSGKSRSVTSSPATIRVSETQDDGTPDPLGAHYKPHAAAFPGLFPSQLSPLGEGEEPAGGAAAGAAGGSAGS